VVAAVIDTIKAIFTYVTATGLSIGGLVAIFLMRGDVSASDTRLVIAGFVGSSITFLYGQEVQTRTARQAAAQTSASGAVANGHGPPASRGSAPDG